MEENKQNKHIMLFKPKYDGVIQGIALIELIAIIACFFPTESYYASVKAFLIMQGIILLIYLLEFFLFNTFKSVSIDSNNREITIEQVPLSTKIVIKFEEIKYLCEYTSIKSALDHLLIDCNNQTIQIYCHNIHNYKQLKQELFKIYENLRLSIYSIKKRKDILHH